VPRSFPLISQLNRRRSAFAAAWAEGRAMPQEDAIALALEEHGAER
jgi:hypothetical protein